ncbi:MAG: OsmC family protein [Bacteroidia bacterium]
MQVRLKKVDEPFYFEANNDRNIIVKVDSSAQTGGQDRGATPMELVLMALGGCVSIDLGLILTKQKQVVENYALDIVGERDETPAKAFKTIHLNFQLQGKVDKTKVEKAVELALNKYCSVAQSLSKNIKISYQVSVA